MSDLRAPLARPIGLFKHPLPLLRTPDGIPDGWHVYIDNGVPVLARTKSADKEPS